MNSSSGWNRSLTRRQFLYASGASMGLGFWSPSAGSPASSRTSGEPVVFGTSWYAEAEHGGFYQALVTGIYADYGLDVTIRMGGAGVNILQLLAGGGVDFAMGSSFDVLAAAEAGIPITTVAALCQRNPRCLLAHPDQGIESLEDLRGHPIYVSPGANLTYWRFLKGKWGFTDDQKRPYNSSLGPFLLDQSSGQQGYITSEPYRIRREGGFEPVALLLADYGYLPYGETIETTWDRVRKQPDQVRRFVEASIKGWYSYLQDPEPANTRILQENPQMSRGLLAYGWEQLQQRQFVSGGDAAQLGIGAMTEQRWQDLLQMMSTEMGMVKSQISAQQLFTLEFVNQGPEYYGG